jgi:hypothetical protein
VFPARLTDDKYNFLDLHGDFWKTMYVGADLVADVMFAMAQEYSQANSNYVELVNVLSRETVPLYHSEQWYALKILESQLVRDSLRYGDDTTYGAGYSYGSNLIGGVYRAKLPDGLISVPVITSRVSLDETEILVNGVDYYLKNGFVYFSNNPFERQFDIEPVSNDLGDVTDRTATLWLYSSKWDHDYLYNNYGYMLFAAQTTSEQYYGLIRTTFDSFTAGTAHTSVANALGYIFSAPVAVSNEIVEAVLDSDDSQLVVTDKHVYRGELAATALKTAGDLVYKGESLFDTVNFYDLSRGDVPPVAGIALDVGMLPAAYSSSLFFPNRDVPLVVEENVDGKTKVSFEIMGNAQDVSLFFDDMHNRAIAGGLNTLAELLDVRGTSATTQPTAASLPSTINPCELLVKNVLRFNCAFAKITVISNGISRPELINSSMLRKLIPPWFVLMLYLELDIAAEAISPPSEEVDSWLQADDVEEVIPANSLIEEVELFYTETPCV